MTLQMKNSEPKDHTYSAAGVDLDTVRWVRERIKAIAAPTHGPQVLGGIGGFSALYELGGYREPVLVSSTDGVGTKLKIATMMGRFVSIGEDLVNLCINDVIVTGAKPLFFLDYIAVGKLAPDIIEALITGMARACREAECALIGGETAQMPGLYTGRDLDLAGFVVGVVERSAILDGSAIRDGDVVMGIPSSGLHTNGYSLVRHVLGLDENPAALGEYHSELGTDLGQALLTPHRPYYPLVRPAVPLLKGMAHITGGGLIENVHRVLPEGLAARLDRGAWSIPPIFIFIQERSDVPTQEMYRVFNMGLGMVMVCDQIRAREVEKLVPESRVVGEVVRATDERRVIL